MKISKLITLIVGALFAVVVVLDIILLLNLESALQEHVSNSLQQLK
jgi:hypothetical protein